MDDECEIVKEVGKSPINSPPLKKLKQSRLPFAPVNAKSPKQTVNASKEKKKRKHSGSDEPPIAPKTPRSGSTVVNATIADENIVVVEEKSGAKAAKESTPKGGSKNKILSSPDPTVKRAGRSKNKSVSTPSTKSSPVARKRGRSAGGKKLNADDKKSVDLDKSSQDGEEEAEDSLAKKKINSEEVKSVDRDTSSQDGKKETGEEPSAKGKKEKSEVAKDVAKQTMCQGKNSHKVKEEGEKKTDKGKVLKEEKEEEIEPVTKGKNCKVERKSVGKGKNSKEEKKLAVKVKNSEEEEKDNQDTQDEKKQTPKSTSKGDQEPSHSAAEGNQEGEEETDFKTGNNAEKEEENSNTEEKADNKAEEEDSSEAEQKGKSTSEKKRKLSDSDVKTSIPKTPRSEIADGETDQTPKDSGTSGEKSLEDTPGKQKGRPRGSKNKIQRKSISSPISESSPGAKTRGRPSPLIRKSSSDLDKSVNLDKSLPSQTEEVEKVEKSSRKSIESLFEIENDNAPSDHKEAEEKDMSQVLGEEKGKKEKDKSKDSGKENSETGGSVERQKTKGRPPGSKNKKTLNQSVCSNPSDDEGHKSGSNTPIRKDSKPVEKTRNLLSFFAASSQKLQAKKKNTQSPKLKMNDKSSEKDLKVVGCADKNEETEENGSGGDEDLGETKGNVSNDKILDKSSNGNAKNAGESIKADADESSSDLDSSQCESDANTSATTSGTPGKTPTSTGKKNPSPLFRRPKALTPKQKEKEASKLLKIEEREKQKQEREKQLQEKNAEKEHQKKLREEERKQKEEERKQKEEEKKQKEEERQKQKEEKDKAKEELKKKRQEEIDAKKQKKEEELQKKEEEKQKKAEEEEEKMKEKNKLKNKFASFFVCKKKENEDDGKETEGPFKEFRVKEDMQLAPIVRHHLSDSQQEFLDQFVSGKQEDPSKTYLKVLKDKNYVRHKSEKTWPLKKEPEADDDDDDIMIIDEDEDEHELGDCSAMIQNTNACQVSNKNHKAKLLLFCENRRPAYWGTWSKKSSSISARRPLAREEIFDYEYDSDDDWEEEETGESLSDSEGEDKDDKEDEGDQYEVDNDVFVPHGYLSDNEGKSDEETEDEEMTTQTSKQPKDQERSRNTEQLKLKQAEFEEEMKKKTKELKPRVIGCLWMADENNNPAYSQLMKILGPHKAVTLCSQLPIGAGRRALSKVCKETDANDESMNESKLGNNKKFVKTFPEEAMPVLVKLLHGNRHAKYKLCAEFTDYWRKLTAGELEESRINQTPVKTQVSESVYISKLKIEAKIKEIAVWKRCLDETTARHIMCWYVPKKIREEYGLADLPFTNSWMYVNEVVKTPKLAKFELDKEDGTPKLNKMRPITAFTEKIPSTPTSTNTSPSSPYATPLHNNSLKLDKLDTSGTSNLSTDTPNRTPNTSLNVAATPGSSDSSGNRSKKKVNLFPAKSQETGSTPKVVTPKGSIASFFKKSKDNNENSPQSVKRKLGNSPKSNTIDDSNDIITLD